MGGRGARLVGTDDNSRGNKASERGFTVRVNKLRDGNKMSFDIMLDNFRKEFTTNFKGRDKNGKFLWQKEHLIAIDEDGYAHTLLHGQEDYVTYDGRDVKGMTIIHNHPNNSAFSRADLRNLKEDGIKGIVASGASGDYIFKLGKNFKYDEFDSALSKSPISDIANEINSYNVSAIKWLRANQKRYGYTFEYREANLVKQGRKNK